jgi:hypothetical protein
MIPNYPRGVEAVQWRHKGTLCWSVYYTQPDTVGAKEQLLGMVRKPSDGIFIIPSCEHPSLNSLNQAVWWLYGLKAGASQGGSDNDR